VGRWEKSRGAEGLTFHWGGGKGYHSGGSIGGEELRAKKEEMKKQVRTMAK